MDKKTRRILTAAAALAMLLMLPLQLNAQHVITRKTAPKPKTEQKSTPKRNQPSPRKSQSRQGSGISISAGERQRVLENIVNNMVYVSGGTFTMGATAEQGSGVYDDERPTHQVTLSSFHIGKYEVTQREWRAVMGSNPSYFDGDDHPVEKISWEDCQKFIRKLNSMTGKRFRLPTEAEWEYAARGGNKSRGYKYSGSNNLDDVAWYNKNIGIDTHSVGTKSPNELGLYDMTGNVWEWCQDCYGAYPSSPQTNPSGPSSASKRVYRGGSWRADDAGCRISNRGYSSPSSSDDSLGLRLAM